MLSTLPFTKQTTAFRFMQCMITYESLFILQASGKFDFCYRPSSLKHYFDTESCIEATQLEDYNSGHRTRRRS